MLPNTEPAGSDCAFCAAGTTPASRVAHFGGFGSPTACSGFNFNTDNFTLPQTAACTLGTTLNCGLGSFVSITTTLLANSVKVVVISLIDGASITFEKTGLSAGYNGMTSSLGSIPYASHTAAGLLGFSASCTCQLSAT